MRPLIIVPLDGSALSEQAVPRAAELARTLAGVLHLVRVHVPIPVLPAAESPVVLPDPALDERVRGLLQEWLTKKAADIAASAGVEVTFELRTGAPAGEIIAAARDRAAAYIVCTTHGHGGWALQWIGSVADAVVRGAPCPVLAMSEAATGAPLVINRVMVPLDGSETAAVILPHAEDIARASGATMDLFRVVAPPWVGDFLSAVQSGQVDRFDIDLAADVAKADLDRVARDLATRGVHATSTVEVATNPTRAILARITATAPDLVAIANHGRGLSRLFMGSVADKVLRAGGRPVLCLRAPRETHAWTNRGAVAAAVAGPVA